MGNYPKRKALPRAYLLFLSYHNPHFLSRRKSHVIRRRSPAFSPLFTLSSQVAVEHFHTPPSVSCCDCVFDRKRVIDVYAAKPHFKHNILFCGRILAYILSFLFWRVILNYHEADRHAVNCHFLPFVQTVQFRLFIFYTRSQSCHRATLYTRARAFLAFSGNRTAKYPFSALTVTKKTKPRRALLYRSYLLFKLFARKKANGALHRVFGVAPRLVLVAIIELFAEMRHVAAKLVKI